MLRYDVRKNLGAWLDLSCSRLVRHPLRPMSRRSLLVAPFECLSGKANLALIGR
jgi:hypothetical protein